MDIFQIIISVNKISLIAFVAVFAFLIYEIYLLFKEQSFKKQPVIPEFTGTEARPINATMIIPEEQKGTHKSNKLLILVLIIMLLFFAAISLISVFSNKQNTKTEEKTITINKTPSPTTVFDLTPTVINQPTVVPSVVSSPTTVIQTITPTQIISPTTAALLISPTITNSFSSSPSPTNLPRSLPVTGKADYVPVIIISSILMFFSLLF